jgi:hypothetical protein
MRKGRTIMQDQDKPAGIVRAVAGIDAAITARHHIAVREFFDDGTEHLSRFTVDPTLAGLERLSQRLAAFTRRRQPQSYVKIMPLPVSEEGDSAGGMSCG